jgi:hypothetical protein
MRNIIVPIMVLVGLLSTLWITSKYGVKKTEMEKSFQVTEFPNDAALYDSWQHWKAKHSKVIDYLNNFI